MMRRVELTVSFSQGGKSILIWIHVIFKARVLKNNERACSIFSVRWGDSSTKWVIMTPEGDAHTLLYRFQPEGNEEQWFLKNIKERWVVKGHEHPSGYDSALVSFYLTLRDGHASFFQTTISLWDTTTDEMSNFRESQAQRVAYVPRMIITDTLKKYGAAKRDILPGVSHCERKGKNNRAENSHQPTRRREKKMRRFTSTKQTQRFFSTFGPIARHSQRRCTV